MGTCISHACNKGANQLQSVTVADPGFLEEGFLVQSCAQSAREILKAMPTFGAKPHI